MASSDNTPPLDVRQRVESDDDLDLLTYNEARVRLSEEVVAEQHLCDELARLASCGPDPAAADRAEASRKRLEALRERLDATTRPRITHANADEFYGAHLLRSDTADGACLVRLSQR
jgi:hypothetical protein